MKIGVGHAVKGGTGASIMSIPTQLIAEFQVNMAMACYGVVG